MTAAAAPVLALDIDKAWYGAAPPALGAVQFAVEPGEVVAIVGANGAGKSTLFRSVVGRVAYVGTVLLDGRPLEGMGTAARVRAGVALVPEEKALFPSLSVDVHLKLAESRAAKGAWDRATVLRLFPNLERRMKLSAGQLSGGEQQMLAISRALLLNPKILMLDEPSLGLAPAIAQSVFAMLAEVRARGTAVVVNEQNAYLVRNFADRLLVLRHGELVAEMKGTDALSTKDLMQHYL
jgi:branched-chain amino acid transport system ATP-binding protein